MAWLTFRDWIYGRGAEKGGFMGFSSGKVWNTRSRCVRMTVGPNPRWPPPPVRNWGDNRQGMGETAQQRRKPRTLDHHFNHVIGRVKEFRTHSELTHLQGTVWQLQQESVTSLVLTQ